MRRVTRSQFVAFLCADTLRSTAFGLRRMGFTTPMDLMLLWGGRAIAVIQMIFGVGQPGRTLSADERTWAASFFGAQLDMDKVRLCEGKLGLLGISRRAFVLGNVVYLPGPWRQSVLLHELVHVWQYQHGGLGYLTRALWAQWFGEGYDFERGLRAGKTFDALNPEQQAQWVQTLYERGSLGGAAGASVLARLQKGGAWG